jgi:hypothetical protein
MQTPMLLGIAGFKESGKDTAGKFLKEWCALNRFRGRTQGLADDLKWSAALALGFEGTREECIAFANSLKADGVYVEVMKFNSREELDADPEVQYKSPIMTKITGREFLQNYGTESHREVFGDDFWIDNLIPLDEVRLARKWGEQDGPSGLLLMPDLMMVTDCRFPNEAERVKDLNGFVLEIQKPDQVNNDSHVSEKPLPREMVDKIIFNNGTLDEFAQKIRHWFDIEVSGALRSGSWA